jgi:hypothetical protein
MNSGAHSIQATIETRGGEHRDVKVIVIRSAGIVVPLAQMTGDRTQFGEMLIPWHRVWEVWSETDGEMELAVGE